MPTEGRDLRAEPSEEQEREARSLAELLMDAVLGIGMGSWRQTEKMLPVLIEGLAQAREAGRREVRRQLLEVVAECEASTSGGDGPKDGDGPPVPCCYCEYNGEDETPCKPTLTAGGEERKMTGEDMWSRLREISRRYPPHLVVSESIKALEEWAAAFAAPPPAEQEEMGGPDAATLAFDAICKTLGWNDWEYPGQIVRGVESLKRERDANEQVCIQRYESLSIARARIELARQALLRDGYFKPHEVSDDIAPRIIERLASAPAHDRWEEARQKIEALMRKLLEGNFGPNPWQAGFAEMRGIADEVLSILRPAAPATTEEKRG